MTAIVLDTGGVEAWSDPVPARERNAALEVVKRLGWARVVVPSAVAVEALTGGPRDAPINRVLRDIEVEEHLPIAHARRAAALRQGTKASAVDAIVAEAAIRTNAVAVLTSDPADIQALLYNAGSKAKVVTV